MKLDTLLLNIIALYFMHKTLQIISLVYSEAREGGKRETFPAFMAIEMSTTSRAHHIRRIPFKTYSASYLQPRDMLDKK
jgi:hypothetical protein